MFGATDGAQWDARERVGIGSRWWGCSYCWPTCLARVCADVEVTNEGQNAVRDVVICTVRVHLAFEMNTGSTL